MRRCCRSRCTSRCAASQHAASRSAVASARWSTGSLPAITHASIEPGSAPSRPRRCAPTASAMYAASDLDRACARLGVQHLRDGRLGAPRVMRGTVEFDDGFEAALFCEHLAGVIRHPLRIARACGARCGRRYEAPTGRPLQHNVLKMFDQDGRTSTKCRSTVRSDAASR